MENSDLIALVSLLISLGALLYSWLTDKKLKKQQIQINEQQLAKNAEEDAEKKKALIEANVYKADKVWKVKIYNKGQACAKNIHFIRDSIKDDNIFFHIPEKLFPYPMLYPQQSFEISLLLVHGHNIIPLVKFVWDDDFAMNREREQVLNF